MSNTLVIDFSHFINKIQITTSINYINFTNGIPNSNYTIYITASSIGLYINDFILNANTSPPIGINTNFISPIIFNNLNMFIIMNIYCDSNTNYYISCSLFSIPSLSLNSTIISVPYTGQTQMLTQTQITPYINNSLNITVNSYTYNISIPYSQLNVGRQTIVLSQGSNYMVSSDSGSINYFIIPLPISILGNNVPYTGKLIDPKINSQCYTVSGAIDTTYSVSSNPQIKIGTYTSTLSTGQNYTCTNKSFTWSITPLPITITGNNVQFTGNTINPSINPTCYKVSGSVDTTYSVSSNPQTNIGTYTSTLSTGQNYTCVNTTFTWSIIQIPLTFNIIGSSFLAYTGSSISPSYTILGVLNPSSTLPYTLSGTTSAINSGSYTITCSSANTTSPPENASTYYLYPTTLTWTIGTQLAILSTSSINISNIMNRTITLNTTKTNFTISVTSTNNATSYSINSNIIIIKYPVNINTNNGSTTVTYTITGINSFYGSIPIIVTYFNK